MNLIYNSTATASPNFVQFHEYELLTSANGIQWTKRTFDYEPYNKRLVNIFTYNNKLYGLELQLIGTDWNFGNSNGLFANEKWKNSIDEYNKSGYRYVIREIEILIEPKRLETFEDLSEYMSDIVSTKMLDLYSL